MLQKFKRALYLLLVAMVCVAGCDVAGEEGGEPPVEESSKEVLVALVGNAPAGFWFFDADSLLLTDSLYLDEAPRTFEMDSTNNIIYWVERNSTNRIHKYDIASKIHTAGEAGGLELKVSKTGSYLLSYNSVVSGLIKVYDTVDMSLVTSDSLERMLKVFTNQDENLFYGITFVQENGTSTTKMIVFDQHLEVENSIPLDFIDFSGFYDMQLSKDGKYFFMTHTNRSDASGRFVVYDLEIKQQIGEFECGPYPSMELSLDGEYVYISPRSSVYETPPKNMKVLSYDVSENSMEVLIDHPSEIGLSGSYIQSENILVSTDNTSLFLTPGARIIQFDIKKKEVLNRFEIPLDSLGRWTTFIFKLGLIPEIK